MSESLVPNGVPKSHKRWAPQSPTELRHVPVERKVTLGEKPTQNSIAPENGFHLLLHQPRATQGDLDPALVPAPPWGLSSSPMKPGWLTSLFLNLFEYKHPFLKENTVDTTF